MLCCPLCGNPDSKLFKIFAWNPEFRARDPESAFSWQGIRNLVPGIQNPRVSWIALHRAIWSLLYFKTYATDISIIKEIKGDVKNQPYVLFVRWLVFLFLVWALFQPNKVVGIRHAGGPDLNPGRSPTIRVIYQRENVILMSKTLSERAITIPRNWL